MQRHATSRRRAAALAVSLAAVVTSANVLPTAVASPSANAGPKTMVALGDSFASAPLVPVQEEQPWGCLRSSSNYAHQLASELGLTLTDMTCSGAQTRNMFGDQVLTPEKELADNSDYEPQYRNPPQLDAVTDDTDVVTLQIGGNDIGFVDLARTCAEGEARGVGCKEAVANKKPFVAIDETADDIAAVLEAIAGASDAAIYVLGYPGIFSLGENAGCPAMAAPEEDAKYLRSIQVGLNAMIQRVADADGAGYSDVTRYVDVYGPSAGHTACDLPLVRWVEPIVPVNAALPVHPNLGGMTAIKDLLVPAVWPRGLPRRDTGSGLPL